MTVLGSSIPEPLALGHDPKYFRALYLMTALDAGHFVAAALEPYVPKLLHDALALTLSLGYLLCPDAAVDRVRKEMGTITVRKIRLSWEKATANCILRWLSHQLMPRVAIVRAVDLDAVRNERIAMGDRVPRIHDPALRLPNATLYFHGRESALRAAGDLVLHIHGGGFVAMSPADHAVYLT
ncbi:hypothetical protein GQ42DRAFT_159304, partial [Ramicandelaber brevisporus]